MNQRLIILFSIFSFITCLGQAGATTLGTKDTYENYVKKLESGSTDIDYTDFRHSFLDSGKYNEFEVMTLRKEMYKAATEKQYEEVIKIARKMLDADYTNMYAHKYLQQTYKILGDNTNYKKYHDIEFGLLKSITNSGNGNSCETGWHVIKVEEEYFILEMVGVSFKQQSVVSCGNNFCDKMDVKTEEGKDKTYYFEINRVLQAQGDLTKD